MYHGGEGVLLIMEGGGGGGGGVEDPRLAGEQVCGQDLRVQVAVDIKEAGVGYIVQRQGPHLPITVPLRHPVLRLELTEESRKAAG